MLFVFDQGRLEVTQDTVKVYKSTMMNGCYVFVDSDGFGMGSE